MLVLRYFAFVGGALTVLLLVCAAMLPKAPPTESAVTSIDEKPTIRIHSMRKWPERIVLDTNAALPAPPAKVEAPIVKPIPSPPAEAVAEEHSPAEAAAKEHSEAADKDRAREAFAELPRDQARRRVAQLRKPDLRRRRVARYRTAPRYAYAPSYAPSYYPRSRQPSVQLAQQPRYGFYW